LIEIARTEFDVTNFDKQQSHFYPDITVSGDVRNQEQLDQALAGLTRWCSSRLSIAMM
jgi:hypothetical protein